jgi:hypothetical protein
LRSNTISLNHIDARPAHASLVPTPVIDLCEIARLGGIATTCAAWNGHAFACGRLMLQASRVRSPSQTRAVRMPSITFTNGVDATLSHMASSRRRHRALSKMLSRDRNARSRRCRAVRDKKVVGARRTASASHPCYGPLIPCYHVTVNRMECSTCRVTAARQA